MTFYKDQNKELIKRLDEFEQSMIMGSMGKLEAGENGENASMIGAMDEHNVSAISLHNGTTQL